MTRRQLTLSMIPKNSFGLEIGVWKGEFSEELLNHTQPLKLFLVDPWLYIPNSSDGETDYSDRWYGGSVAKNQKDMDNIYDSVYSKFKTFDNVIILRCFSNEIQNYVNNNTLDWVYIDGNHSYEYVLKDLNIAFNLIKEKSLIIGDDYDNSREVRDAVNTFITNRKEHIIDCNVVEGQFILKIKK